MASYAQPPAIFDETSQLPSKPSGLRSFLPSRAHKRSPSAGDALLARSNAPGNDPLAAASFLPADHPHAGLPLGERAHNRDAAGGSRPSRRGDKLHHKTKSSVSLKALIGEREKKDTRSPDSPEEGSLERTMKKVKSSTSLSAILKRSYRGRKGELPNETKDRENQRPKSDFPPPIWAQFATQPLEDASGNVSLPDHGRSLEEEVSLYTPKNYDPSKQRNFYDYHQPTLVTKPRPKSDYISSGTTKVREMLGHIQRMPSDKQRNVEKQVQNQGFADARSSQDSKRSSNPGSNRVMAAVSAFNAKEAGSRRSVDSKQIESDFEKLLVSTTGSMLSNRKLTVPRMHATSPRTCETRCVRWTPTSRPISSKRTALTRLAPIRPRRVHLTVLVAVGEKTLALVRFTVQIRARAPGLGLGRRSV